MIPSIKKCHKLMKQYGMLDNIKAHSIMVEKIATLITHGLSKKGIDVSPEKVIAGALMHDIGKTICLNTKIDHALKGVEICRENHLEEISEMVEEHVILKSFAPEGPINEKEIIYYSDKRVNHDSVVSLEERLEYLIDRYANGEEHRKDLIVKNFNQCREVEKKLFKNLDFSPHDLKRLIHA